MHGKWVIKIVRINGLIRISPSPFFFITYTKANSSHGSMRGLRIRVKCLGVIKVLSESPPQIL